MDSDSKAGEETTTIEIFLTTRYNGSMFGRFLLEKWSRRLFVLGRLADESSIELYVDNILDNLQWREVELLHFRLNEFIEDYFDQFIADLTETIVHEYIHFLDRSLLEEWVKRMSRLVEEVMKLQVCPTGPNLIALNC